ncbi:unnamed protein product [Mytilus edulis]|uniref:WSC domain-containing protein n=1 Tax=Mytilus edulis TaxID=6550 RepID=A0A8S3U418_MYTED|nr:unnamed protein product [Mytilus edulis]
MTEFSADCSLLAYSSRKQYIGCYVDKSAPRTLPDGYLKFEGNMTIDVCLHYCCGSLTTATFMGTKDADHCFCSTVARSTNFVPRNDPDSGIICNIPCSGKQSETCGGFWSLSTYKIECSTDPITFSPTTNDISTVTKVQTIKSALTTIFSSTINTSPSTDNKNAAATEQTAMPGTTSVFPPVITTIVLPPVTTKSVLSPVTSTTSQLTIGINISACSCANSYCLSMNRTLLTELELSEKLLILTKEIAVNRKETSLYISTKRSAYDTRKSSTYLGIGGIIIILLPFIFIVLIDILMCLKK